MQRPSERTLLLIGSGPGIGGSVASLFAQRYFDRVALFARTASQLQKDREAVLSAAATASRPVDVQTWQVDIANPELFKNALREVELWGTLECVYFNAARVEGSLFFDFPIDGIEYDLKVSVIALYIAAEWAFPLLLRAAETLAEAEYKPSFFVTSSFLPADPIPQLFALSMAKAAQANLVKSLERTFAQQGVHVGLVVVGGGPVSVDSALSPANIAEAAWKLFDQEKKDWRSQATVLENGGLAFE
ncbi:hypothetical protein FE257_002464 [Aspergillus nanangensis]|uniref:Uncharacterized protein n=1 Tax=Aspergillus nanangensis TaxID=2582783 RepID=A0AAD4CTB2_ASPNN|nr:hypothetical protein FE257_002464 [Aspergillus nanangensis]